MCCHTPALLVATHRCIRFTCCMPMLCNPISLHLEGRARRGGNGVCYAVTLIMHAVQSPCGEECRGACSQFWSWSPAFRAALKIQHPCSPWTTPCCLCRLLQPLQDLCSHTAPQAAAHSSFIDHSAHLITCHRQQPPQPQCMQAPAAIVGSVVPLTWMTVQASSRCPCRLLQSVRGFACLLPAPAPRAAMQHPRSLCSPQPLWAPPSTSSRGTSYAACAYGVNPTAAQPCELGVTGTDALGTNISSTAVACAPSSCASFAACSSECCLEQMELT